MHASAIPDLVIRDLTVEVRIREDSDFQTALTKLRELSQPLGGLLSATGQRSVDVVDAGNRLIQLTITQPAITERVRQVVEQAIQIVERRINEHRHGRAADPAPGRRPHPGAGSGRRRSGAHPRVCSGRTAKLTFRLVDSSVSPDQAQQGRVPPEFGAALRHRQGRQAALRDREARDGDRRGPHRRAARLRPAHQRADRQLQVQHQRRARVSPRSRRRTSAGRSRSCSTTR